MYRCPVIKVFITISKVNLRYTTVRYEEFEIVCTFRGSVEQFDV